MICIIIEFSSCPLQDGDTSNVELTPLKLSDSDVSSNSSLLSLTTSTPKDEEQSAATQNGRPAKVSLDFE